MITENFDFERRIAKSDVEVGSREENQMWEKKNRKELIPVLLFFLIKPRCAVHSEEPGFEKSFRKESREVLMQD